MSRYFLSLSYNGKCYNGWQIQNNAPSLQQTIQRCLSTILRQDIGIVGAGRTDTGVHAAYYVAHFDMEGEISDTSDFVYHLNAILPDDISISKAERVEDGAHARFDAVSREYKYYISLSKNPFRREYSCRLPYPLDLEKMNIAAAALLDYEDFACFAKLHSNNKTTICHIEYAFWQQEDDMLIFNIRADRFLRNMVRAIVGTLIDVGRGKISMERFHEIIESGSRSSAGTSVPPQGLFLTDVKYK